VLLLRGLVFLLGTSLFFEHVWSWARIGFWRDLWGHGFLGPFLSVFVVVGLVVVPTLRFPATPYILLLLGVAGAYLLNTWDMVVPIFIGVLFLAPQFRAHFGGPDSTKERLLTPFRNWFLGIFGMSLLIYLAVELPSIKSSLTNTRHESNCKATKSPEACGQNALHIINSATRVADLEDGTKRLDAICKEGNLSACRYANSVRGPGSINQHFHDELLRNLNRECSNQVAEACWALVQISKTVPQMGYRKIIEIMKPHCLERGDYFSCWAVFGAAFNIDVDYSPFEPGEYQDRHSQTPAPYCEESDDPAVLAECCSEAISIGYKLATHSACSRVLGDDIQARAARFIGEAEFQGVPISEKEHVETNEFELACESGDALACVAEVLRREDGRPLGTPTPEGMKEDWEHLLAGPCQNGSNLACLAHAIRLIDVPLNEKPDMERAEQILKTSCDRGHNESCWWLVSMFEGYKEQAMDVAIGRCREGDAEVSACRVVEDLVLQKLGLNLWKLDRFEESRAHERQCIAKDPVSCSEFLWIFDRFGQIHPVRIRRLYSAAELACKLERTNGCEWATYFASMHPARGVKEHHEKLCRRRPRQCKTYEPKIR